MGDRPNERTKLWLATCIEPTPNYKEHVYRLYRSQRMDEIDFGIHNPIHAGLDCGSYSSAYVQYDSTKQQQI